MAFFDDIFDLGLKPVTAPIEYTIVKPLNYVSGELSGKSDAEQRAQDYQNALWNQRQQSKKKQLDLLNQLSPPEMSPYQERRLAALEDESKPGPLVEDPLFQGDRSALISGGQQLASGIQNKQIAEGIGGGFRNTGSLQDVYDRLGAQLSALAQRSRQVKEQKRDVVAEARQRFLDAQTNFGNARKQAEIAIEQGDAAAATSAINAAYQAREQIAAAQRQMTGALLSGGAAVAGAAMGAPVSMQMPQQSQLVQPSNYPSQPMYSSSGISNIGDVDFGSYGSQNFSIPRNRPYYSF